MIDRTQRILYELCDIKPSESWDYTDAEITQMIDVKIKARDQLLEIDKVKHAGIICAILNSAYGPYLKKGDKYPYKTDDFLKNEAKKSLKVSESEKSKRWSAAGREMMDVVRQHENEIKGHRR